MSPRILRPLVWFRRQSPVKITVFGYMAYVVVGWLLLCLPWAWQSGHVRALDNLFTSASAVSTTGLGTVSTSDSYSFFGEVVVLVLIQLGGIGYMTLGSFVMLAMRRRLSTFRQGVVQSTFSLPEGMHVGTFIANVIVYTVVVEVIGAAALWRLFHEAGVDDALWQAVFHSVSSFCTAGFSLFNDSLVRFRADIWVNVVVAVLSYLGAIGFIVVTDIFHVFAGRSRHITMTTKIILHATLWISLIGWALVFLSDSGHQQLPLNERLLSAGFQAMAAMTTVGFNTYPIDGLSLAPMLVLLVLMVIGASPSGTGGGVKSTTISICYAAVRSAIRGQDRITFWKRPVPDARVIQAFAILVFYLFTLIVGCLLLLLVDGHRFESIVFEAASALGTVGLSRGITPELTGLGKLVVIALMMVGRIGPVTLGVAIFVDHAAGDDRPTEQDVAI